MKSIKYFLALLTLVALIGCSTTTTTKEEKTSPTMENVIEGLKNIQLPKF